MRRGTFIASALIAVLAAGTALGEERNRGAAGTETQARTAPGWIERGFARLERAIERLEAKLSGRDRGAMMEGCQDMMGDGMMGGGMMGGGMMGGPRPNERWRGPEGKR